ncbi:hypothetical protein [Halapricum hydrolyticum]|uniref:DNA polymerase V family protein n=1 Tax=Halapricum hydrolyticum TaxID=2979991 RepID=A0AAE3IBP1_9EURY|nr:hypothetical protein [Halapricum hydrolyticum]MCU4718475.1 DNA polymerase V family protein [Halapricum hydrolyticum]MCU4727506.1 DNA polymerase V family protein [Halapricum hydrolyticum]
MDCSRCGGDLEVYSLGEQKAYVCADCGFVDTPVEHEVQTRPEEPWERALERFYQKHIDSDAAIVGSGETAALVEVESNADDASGDRSANEEGRTADENDEHGQRADGDKIADEPDESDEADESTDESDEADEAIDESDEADEAIDESDEADEAIDESDETADKKAQ